MSIDTHIRDAVHKAVQENNHGEELSRRLLAWIGALMEGNAELSDKESRTRYLELLYEAARGADETGSH